jgi:predicted secreted hydrolase
MARRPFGWKEAVVMTFAAGLAAAFVFGHQRQDVEPAPSAPAPKADTPSLIEERIAPSATADQTRPEAGFAAVMPGRAFAFPQDHGAHPAFRTEWWYVTGWLETNDGPIGFQVTFFRTRPGADDGNPSAFAPRQVIFAHAAVSDPKLGKLSHDQRIARQGFGLAEARVGDADLVLDDWSLRRDPDGRFRTRVKGADFALDLVLSPTQPVLLQGAGGYSRKGPEPSQASYYYTLPHLAVSGRLEQSGRARQVKGQAWMDREWSSTLLDPSAVGWDWAGINLDDGSALTAFQVRDAQGGAVWAGGSLRTRNGALTVFGPDDVRFRTVREWRSPRTGATWPVERVIEVRTAGGPRRFPLKPMFDDQELDSRAFGGPVYWEGAVTTDGGRGYLELTGYVTPLRM